MQSALLREELLRARKDAGLTQEQVAKALDWSPSKLIRIEGGKSGITQVDLSALMDQYGVDSDSRRERLKELARGAREPAWWSGYREYVLDQYLTYVGFEAGASVIRVYHGGVFPGLIQIPEYAAVVGGITDDHVEAARRAPGIRLRMERRRRLDERPDPPEMHYLLDESIVRRQVGVRSLPGVQQQQIRYAVAQAQNEPNITVQVLPYSAGYHDGLFLAGFTLLEFDGPLDDVMYLEAGRGGSQLITGPQELVSEYRGTFQDLTDEAMSPDQSLEFMLQVAAELDQL